MRPSPSIRAGGAKLRHLFVSPNVDDRKFFYGLNIELSYQAPRFSPNPFAVEFRPILGVRDLGWEFIVNPIVDLEFGPAPTSSFAPALRLARSIAGDLMLGVIDFSAFGFDVNFGLGFGLTDSSDKIVTKLIIGRAF